MRKVCFVISTLSHGGAERVISLLANHWAENNKYEVTVLLLGTQENQFYRLSPKLKVRALGLMAPSTSVIQGLKSNFFRIRSLRRELKGIAPDTVISFLFNTNLLCILASRLCPWKLIISERNHPRFNGQGAIWDFLRPVLYRFADVLVVQTREIERAMMYMNFNTVVIANPLIPLKTVAGEDRKTSTRGERIIAVGSFSAQKRFDVLLKAFALMSKEIPEASLTIAGDGPLLENMKALAHELDITHRVQFPGVVTNVAEYFKGHELFVMSSDFEGFPNALIEAMGFGMPCISTNCPSGPSDIIQNDISGFLVPVSDPQSLANAMIRLLREPDRRERFGLRALEIRSRLSITTISDEWGKVIA